MWIQALPQELPGFGRLVTFIAVDNWVRYSVTAFIAWLLGYVLFKKHWWPRKVVQRWPEWADLRREIGWSLSTVVIYGLVGAGTIWLSRSGFTQMYRRIDDHSMVWFWLSIVLAIVVHDTYFYWTHRLMHRPRWYRWFHRVHHLSTNPSPWAAYAFGPLEALVQACIFPVVVMIMPIHPFAFFIVMIWQIVFNVIGHTGYEYHPRWLMDTWLGKLLNTPTNHAQHHERLRGNYGLYFNVWDRLMGTNHPDYETRFREVTSRGRDAQ